jgi:branched-chain amino acid transport system permease protein
MIVASRSGQVLLGVAALAVASMPLWASVWHMQLATTALVASLFALSLQVLVGATGLVSLGQAGFFGLGAYAVYLLGSPPVWVTLPAAMLAAGLAALVIGPLVLRTKGFFFLMATLAFGQMLFFAFHDTPLGGGSDGQFIPRPFLGWAVSRAERPAVFLLLNLAVLVGVYAGLCWLMRTMLGHALQGIRSNENRMIALGHDVQRLKLIAFVLSGALAGLAGHMSALTDGFVTPDLLGWHRSAEALLMVLLGGIGALHGPILGAFALTAVEEAGTLLTDRPRLVEGVVFLVAVLFLRHGLAGLRLGFGVRNPVGVFSRASRWVASFVSWPGLAPPPTTLPMSAPTVVVGRDTLTVMAGRVPAIFALPAEARMTGTHPAMTERADNAPSTADPDANPTFTGRDLTRRFGGLLAVDRVSLSLERGRLHAVIGPNGAGKSTLVNLLSGEIPCSGGCVSLNGGDISPWPAWKRGKAGIGRTFQRTNIMRDMTVLENVRLAAQGRSIIGLLKPANDRDLVQSALAALQRTGLDDETDAIAGTLSHGQARLLEIAMALAGTPLVLLLDEPLAGLGPEETEPVVALLRDLARDHAVLLVEHDMDVVFAVAEIITVMVDGRVLAYGTPADVRASVAVRDAYLGHGI